MTTYYVPHTGTTAADAEANAIIFCTDATEANLIRDKYNFNFNGWTTFVLDSEDDDIPLLTAATVDAPNFYYRSGADALVLDFHQSVIDEIISNNSSSSGNTSSDSDLFVPFP